jgi:hypothetical protein
VNEGGQQQQWTRSEINQMAFAARDGEASKDDARTLLELFCECVEQGQISARVPVADRLLEHVREAFRAYLDGQRVGNRGRTEIAPGVFGIPEIKIGSIGAALGLIRKRGSPKRADEQMRMQMAAEVLHHRLNGMSHQEALAAANEELRIGVTTISEAWAAYKSSALHLVRIDRGTHDFTKLEKERLCEIFLNEEWFIAPGN